MALRKATDDLNETATDDLNETAAEAVTAEVTEEKAVALATKAATPAVKKQSTVKSSFWKTDEITQSIIANAESGDRTQIVATSGTFKTSGDKKDLGAELTFCALGFRTKYVCSTGENSEAGKEYYTAAYDNDPARDGLTVDEWVEEAKGAGFSKTKKVEYLDLFVHLIDHSKKSADDMSGKIVVLQLSFMSKKQWKMFAEELMMKVQWGEVQFDGAPLIKAVAVSESNANKQDYSKFVFSLAS